MEASQKHRTQIYDMLSALKQFFPFVCVGLFISCCLLFCLFFRRKRMLCMVG